MSQRALARITAAAIGLLLPAGVFAAGQVGEPADVPVAAEAGGIARPTGFGSLAVIDEPSGGLPEVSVQPSLPAPTTSSVPASGPRTGPAASLPPGRGTTTSTTAGTVPPGASGGATTTPTLPAGAPDPGPPAKPEIPATSAWDIENEGVTLRMRLDPATPRAGAPVKFVIEMSSTSGPCCGVFLNFGDGENYTAELPSDCSAGAPPAPRNRTVTATHTYANPGIYWMTFNAMSIDACATAFQWPRGVTTFGCIGVGPSKDPLVCPLPERPGAGYS